MTAQPSSFAELVRRATAAQPDRQAVADEQRSLTWRELSDSISRLAAALAGTGLRSGDRLALQAPSSVEFVLCYLAALQAGLVVVPINPAYTLPEVEHIVADSGARLLASASVPVLTAAAELRDRYDGLQVLAAAGAGSDELPSLAGLLAAAGDQRLDADGRRDDDLAVLLYTSGTSGRPKGAMLPVRALLANLDQLARLDPPPITADDRVFLPLPLFHVFGLNAGLGLALWFGASLTLSARFDAAGTLRAMAAAGATAVVGAPLEYARWAQQAELAEGFGQVRLALSGSAPLDPGLIARYAELGVALHEGYGLTEAAPVVTLDLTPADGGGWRPAKPGSVGRPLPGVQLRLVDADREPVEPGDLGFVEVCGPNLFTGYWPDGAGGPDADGWFGTGDLAVADDDGDHYLVGRRSDLVLVNGFNVYPAEVEAVFSKLPGVREVAVLGLVEGSTDEVLVAYVVPADGVELDPDALLEQAAGSLARFKLPRRVIEVATLPYTATGKVMKWRLRPSGQDG